MVMPRKSAALHELSGTRSQATLPEEDALPSSRPQYPKNISPATKKIFKKLCQLLDDFGILVSPTCGS